MNYEKESFHKRWRHKFFGNDEQLKATIILRWIDDDSKRGLYMHQKGIAVWKSLNLFKCSAHRTAK